MEKSAVNWIMTWDKTAIKMQWFWLIVGILRLLLGIIPCLQLLCVRLQIALILFISKQYECVSIHFKLINIASGRDGVDFSATSMQRFRHRFVGILSTKM